MQNDDHKMYENKIISISFASRFLLTNCIFIKQAVRNLDMIGL